MAEITPIVMPKWGLSMKEGKVNAWLVEVGTRIEVGMPILDVETDKIANEVEAPDAGLLRRQLAAEGDVLPVKALLGVLAEESVSDAEIDAFIAAYQVPDEGDGEEDETSPSDQHVEVDGIRVRYQQTGSGSPVLLIHGFGGDLNNWLFNIDELASRHTVIALDLPAHGASDVRLPASHDLAGMAAFVHRFLQETDTPGWTSWPIRWVVPLLYSWRRMYPMPLANSCWCRPVDLAKPSTWVMWMASSMPNRGGI